jgi:predicted O-methyltransferase YrrM
MKEFFLNTLFAEPLSSLLVRLFAEARASEQKFREEMTKLSPEARTAMMSTESDFKILYTHAKDHYLAVPPDTANLLYLLARSSGARSMVEFGTSFGISTLHLAAALRDNGGGRLITSEFEPGKVATARANIQAGGLSDLVDIRVGNALETLAKDLPDRIDFLLLDGAKGLYPKILALVEPRLAANALVVADNADMCPEFVKLVRAPGGHYVSVPFNGEVEVSMKLDRAAA